nr:putative manganese transporter [Marinomonas balearica]
MAFNKRAVLPCLVTLLWFIPELSREITSVLADAFLQVSAFVAVTLAIYYGISHRFSSLRLQSWMKGKPYTEVIFAGVMGVLPGCGGAIIIITQYTQRKIGFGAVVAVLTSTMGDAAFLLISQKPNDAVIVLSISVCVGICTGLIINKISPHPNLLPDRKDEYKQTDKSGGPLEATIVDIWISRISIAFWCILLIPATTVAILLSMQYDVNSLLSFPPQTIESLGAISGFSCLCLWAMSAKSDRYSELAKENNNALPKHWIRKVAQDTQFVTSWVVVAFILFELVVHFFGQDMFNTLQELGSASILFATFVGLLPGCGPQIMITGLFLQGAIPLSAQLANAISNDGDALFPAIALAPKAAILATVYSTIPALIAGYSYYWLVEHST